MNLISLFLKLTLKQVHQKVSSLVCPDSERHTGGDHFIDSTAIDSDQKGGREAC
jgi:hypothetical protein